MPSCMTIEELAGAQPTGLLKAGAQLLRYVADFRHSGKVPLTESSLQGVSEYIKTHNCQNVLFVTGAGISTSAGIPDLKSPGTGAYEFLERCNLTVEIFDIDYFKKNPAPFYKVTNYLLPRSIRPTVTHYFMRMLHQKGIMLRNYTQNLDTLEYFAGLPEEAVIAPLGNMRSGYCMQCSQSYSVDEIRDKVDNSADDIPYCDKCGHFIRPDIMLFREPLPVKNLHTIVTDFLRCDLLVIMGTSLSIQPFASVIDLVGRNVPRLLINNEPVSMFESSRSLGDRPIGNDVFHMADCDQATLDMAEALGMKEELLEMHDCETARLDSTWVTFPRRMQDAPDASCATMKQHKKTVKKSKPTSFSSDIVFLRQKYVFFVAVCLSWLFATSYAFMF